MERNSRHALALQGITTLLLVGLAVASGLWFLMECAVGSVLFFLTLLRLNSIQKQDARGQATGCKPMGFWLLPPSLCVTWGAVHFLLMPQIDVPTLLAYAIAGASALLAAGQVLHILLRRGDKSIAARVSLQVCLASLSAPASMIVAYTMIATGMDDAGELVVLVCMSAAVFGLLALLLAANLVLTALCGYKGTRESVRVVSAYYRERKLLVTRAVIAKDALLVMGKLAISLVSGSVFMFANALFSVGMGVARFSVIRMNTQTVDKQIRSYRRVGWIIAFASFCFVLYAVRLFFGGSTASYPMTIALIIACYTFVEFGVNIREALRLRKSPALVARALRSISFASTLLCFVLTQTAIMSFASEGDNRFSNALAGVVFGGGAMLVGVYVVVNSVSLSKDSVR